MDPILPRHFFFSADATAPSSSLKIRVPTARKESSTAAEKAPSVLYS